MPQSGHVTLAVYNLMGQVVRTLVNAQEMAGWYTIAWDGKDENNQHVASGTYLYRLEVADRGVWQQKKMVLVR